MRRRRRAAAQPAATSGRWISDERSLQRSISVHWQFSSLDSCRSHLELQRETYVYGLQCWESSDWHGPARSHSATGTGASVCKRSQKQKLGRVLKVRCAETRFCFHSL